MIRGTWIDRLEARMAAQDDTVALEKRVAKLEVMLADALSWIAELGEDMLDRTATTHIGGIDG